MKCPNYYHGICDTCGEINPAKILGSITSDKYVTKEKKMSKVFKHELGATAKSKSRGFKGNIGSRSECQYGCNRYLIEPLAGKDGKLSKSYWFDEDDIEVVKSPKKKKVKKNTGGPASTKC